MLILQSYWPLILVGLGCWWAVWSHRSSRVRFGKRRLSSLLACRLVFLLCVGTALCVPRLVWQAGSQYTIFALDVSESIGEDAIRDSLTWLAQMKSRLGPDRVKTLAFAGGAAWFDELDPDSVARIREEIGIQETNFEVAIRSALAGHPAQALPRLVLLSDGRSGSGDIEAAVAAARGQGLEIFARELELPSTGDCWLGDVTWPPALAVGRPALLEVDVFCPLSTQAQVEVWAGERRLANEDLTLRSGAQQVRIPLRPEAAGLWVVQLRLTAAGDSFPQNDVRNTSSWVQPARRVWLLNGPGSSRSLLPEMLRSQGFEVRSGSRLPPDLGSGSWDSLVLNNVHPRQLGTDQMQLIRDYASNGGGVVFLAGENSFGANGYAETDIERILPVTFETKEEIGLALLLLMDKSNSMKGEKIELARQAILAVVDQLQPDQVFGLVTFDHQPNLVVPLQEVGDSKAAMREQIQAVEPGAHTNIMPALEQSYYLLAGHPAASRHIILISDGRTYPDDYQGIVEEINTSGITVSTVGIGTGADQELLSQIAEWGKGKSYFALDPRELPRIFLEETLRMQSSLVEESLNLQVRAQAELLSGIPMETAPALSGLVRVKARPEAEVILETSAEDPVLVRWRHGLGVATFLAVDLGERWTSEWLKWPYLTRLTSQLVRDNARTFMEAPLELFLDHLEGGRIGVELQARDENGSPLSRLEPVVEITREGRTESVPLLAEGRGRYRAEFRVDPTETAFVRLLEPASDQVLAVLPSYPDELRHQPPDRDFLQKICESSGGRLNPTDADLLQSTSRRTTQSSELWPLLVSLGLVAFLVEIGIRRWPV